MTIRSLSSSLGRALLTLSLVLLAACGGGGGGGSGGGSGGSDPASNPSTEPRPPVADGGGSGGGGEPPPRNRQTEACFRVFNGGCLTNAELEAKAQELAAEFKARREQSLLNAWRTRERADSFLWYLERINVAEAQAHLELSRGGEAANLPGRGVTIGFIDSGIRQQHEAFDLTSSVAEELLSGAADEGPDEFSHGTAVASIAAGRYGVAYGADIKMFAIPLSDDPSPAPITTNQLSASDFQSAERFRHVFSKEIDILNLSIAFSGGIKDYSETDLRNNYSRTIRALAQPGQQDKTILVWAAGNAGNRDTGRSTSSSPEILAGLVARIDELQGHSVAVVSIGRDGDISDFSNHCGIAREFCIAAPGEGVGVAAKGNNLWALEDVSGTSFAAPMVSGGLAVMKQLFRGQLSNEQLVSRLFATARDDGIYANTAIYGHGLLDLGAATKPWGTPGFTEIGQSVSGQGAPVIASSLAAGPALGDALSQALVSQEIAAFDSLGAPFWFDAGAFTVEAPGTTVAARLQEFLHPINRQPMPRAWQFHLQENAPAAETGHLALAHAASRLTMTAPQGLSASFFQSPQRLQGLALSWNPEPLPMLSLGAGYLHEPESLLGTRANGAFGRLSAETVFLSAGLNTTAGRWTLAAVGEVGAVKPSLVSSRLMDHVSSLATSAFRLQAGRTFDNGHTLRFSLSQPLRVGHGAAVFSLPTGRTQDGGVTGTSFSSPLAPSGRQLDLTTTLEMPLAGGDLSLGVTRSRQPGHQHTAAPEWSFFTGYRATW